MGYKRSRIHQLLRQTRPREEAVGDGLLPVPVAAPALAAAYSTPPRAPLRRLRRMTDSPELRGTPQPQPPSALAAAAWSPPALADASPSFRPREARAREASPGFSGRRSPLRVQVRSPPAWLLPMAAPGRRRLRPLGSTPRSRDRAPAASSAVLRQPLALEDAPALTAAASDRVSRLSPPSSERREIAAARRPTAAPGAAALSDAGLADDALNAEFRVEDVQRFLSECCAVKREIGTLAGGAFPTEAVAKLLRQVPSSILRRQRWLPAVAEFHRATAATVPNSTARGLVLHLICLGTALEAWHEARHIEEADGVARGSSASWAAVL
jgi:hypothetical protein